MSGSGEARAEFEVWCWEDGTEYGHPETTCTLLENHTGDHDWLPDANITVIFPAGLR